MELVETVTGPVFVALAMKAVKSLLPVRLRENDGSVSTIALLRVPACRAREGHVVDGRIGRDLVPDQIALVIL